MTSLLPKGPLGNETLQYGEQILRFLSLLSLHTAMIKIKTLESEPRFVGVFFSFVCLGTLLLPYQLLSSINNTVSTKFKFLYEMLTNLILFSFFFYHLYYLIIFQKSDLNDMVFDGELWELGDIPPIRCVSGRNGYLWNTIISSNR